MPDQSGPTNRSLLHRQAAFKVSGGSSGGTTASGKPPGLRSHRLRTILSAACDQGTLGAHACTLLDTPQPALALFELPAVTLTGSVQRSGYPTSSQPLRRPSNCSPFPCWARPACPAAKPTQTLLCYTCMPYVLQLQLLQCSAPAAKPVVCTLHIFADRRESFIAHR